MYRILSPRARLLQCLFFPMFILIFQYSLATETSSYYQDRTITGRVTSADDGQGFPGASIAIKGTDIGTITDADGNFSLRVPSSESILHVSAIGYASVEMLVGTQTTINIALEPDITSLSEVVVVGYGTVKKSDITGSIARVTSAQIEAMPVQNALQALQGRTAGVDITSNTRPGEMGTIRIRGTRSLGAGSEPLYVVDGIPLQSGGMDAFNPHDIESIEVLKDASAAAIYGSRAANGVILVTTKKGKNGVAQVNYAGSVYTEKINDLMEMFDGGEYAEYRRNAYRSLTNASKYTTPFPNPVDDKRILGADPFAWESIAAGYTWEDKSTLTPKMRPTTSEEQALWGVTEVPIYDGSKVPTTDWTDYVNQTGVTQDHNLSVSMGTDRIRTFFSGGYLNQKGTSQGQDYKRYSGRLNLELRATDWLTVGASMMASYGIQNYGYAAGGSRGARTIYEAAKGMLPFAVPYDTTGKYIYYPGGDIGIVNPIMEDDYVINERSTLRTMGSFFAEAKIIDGLKFRVNFGPDMRNYENGQFQFKESALRGGGAPSSTNYASSFNEKHISWTLENLMFYDRTINNHKIGLTLLQSSSMENRKNSSMTATNLPYNTQLWYNLGSTARGALDGWGSSYTKRTLMSYMARVNYTFKDRYLLTASGRWDGASVLAEGNKWDFFPSMALAWKINQENFLSSASWLSELKLRVGVGVVGNQSIEPYTVLGALIQVPYVFGNLPANGYVPSNPKGGSGEQGGRPNPTLSWEKTSTVNLGLDFGILNDRIYGSLEYYVTTTRDMLMSQTLNPVGGYSQQSVNAGMTENRGIELTLSSNNIEQGDFRWKTDFTISINKGSILESYNGAVDDITRSWFIGKPLQVYYDYKKIGIWQIADADEMAKFNEKGATYKAGDIRVEDVNGDYKIDPNNDRQIVGTAAPKWNGSLTNTFSYKGFELSALLYARWGQIIEGGAVDMQGRYASRKVDYWTPTNPTNEYPRADFGNGGVPVHLSSMNYQDGSFVKVRYIALGYTVPADIARRARLNNVRVYTQVLNPFLYSKVDFLDPDFTIGGTNRSGFAFTTRSVVFGLNVAF
ncbi:SusC/RagA family TonB-linked outer membrane protein [Pseudochryseolinea flava]|uniref:TonB-dependent receptor n=1 Tax=Pseudochryseolinea flava TaxID=2059302 RepID=A0A364Y4L6_9BACT|nr:TonB-dependent receptor [Pseudochryseolinea flava]RAW00991.1 TonB-dependent receptor [Pseudochryseolinea flava]